MDNQKGLMPLKILIMGDFNAGEAQHLPISRNNFQDVMSELNPRLSMKVANKLTLVHKELNIDLSFPNMTAFRPESVADQVGPIREIVEVRNVLNDLREKHLPSFDAKDRLTKLSAAFLSLADTEVGQALSSLKTRLESGEDVNLEVLDGTIRRLDEMLSDQVDEILHHPNFQRLESAWRGLKLLIDRADYPSAVRYELFNVGQKEFIGQFEEQIFPAEYDDICEVPLSVILADFEFCTDDLDTLKKMAERVSVLQVVFVASLSPEFFGLRNIVHVSALPDISSRLTGPAYTGWRNFFESQSARWTSFTVNRFLLRDTYGRGHEQVEIFDYNEKVDPGHPQSYLWGCPIWLMGCSLARSFASNGTCVMISGLGLGGEHGNIPTREYPLSMTKKVRIPVEVVMTDEKVWDLIKAGVTPLNGIEDTNIAYFPLCANAYRLGGVTLHSTLSYHLYIGHVFHQYFRLHQQIPAGSKPEEIAQFVQGKVWEIISPFGGENPDDTVKVTVTPSDVGGGVYMIGIHIQPRLQIEAKDVEFTLQLQVQV